MNIQLAGYNTDVQNGGNTPETLSASYARISRDPRPINILRKEAAGSTKLPGIRKLLQTSLRYTTSYMKVFLEAV